MGSGAWEQAERILRDWFGFFRTLRPGGQTSPRWTDKILREKRRIFRQESEKSAGKLGKTRESTFYHRTKIIVILTDDRFGPGKRFAEGDWENAENCDMMEPKREKSPGFSLNFPNLRTF